MAARVKLNREVKRKPRGGSFKPEYNEQVERLAKLGVTDTEIALFFNVARKTVHNWKSAHPDFFEALSRGKLEADNEVAAALFKNATGFTYQQEKLIKKRYSKTKNGVTNTWEKIESVWVEEHSLPQTVAQIFYLTNRRPDLFKRNAQESVAVETQATAEEQKVYSNPDEVLAEMKKRGIVMIENSYTERK